MKNIWPETRMRARAMHEFFQLLRTTASARGIHAAPMHRVHDEGTRALTRRLVLLCVPVR
jgi:hypothetical protein